VSSAALDNIASDVRYAVRGLWRSPLFTAVALLTLAIGCGANTAIFSVVDGVLLKPLPYPDPDELVAVWHVAPGAPGLADVSGGLRLSPSMLVTYQEENRTFEQIGMWVDNTVTVTGLGEPEQVRNIGVLGDVLQALQVPPLLGRWLDATDESPTDARRVMLTYAYWQRRFGGDPNVIGRTITINSTPNEIVGVMPQGFRILDTQSDLVMPIPTARTGLTPYPFFGRGVARLKPGVSIEQANADIARLLPQWVERFGYPGPGGGRAAAENYLGRWKIAPALRPLKDDVVGDVGNVLWVVMGTIGVVLVIACANVMNLLLVRAEKRRPELAVRGALGAGSWRIARAIMIESVLVGVAGGALGVGVAAAALGLIKRLAPATLPRVDAIALDARTMLFSLVVSAIAGLLLGLVPALRYGGPKLAVALRSGGRTGMQGKSQHRVQDALVVGQVALALVLIVSSVLMIRTFQALRTVEPGFTEAQTLQTVRLGIPPQLEGNARNIARLQSSIAAAIERIPGVSSVGFATALPMDGTYGFWDSIAIEGRERDASAASPLRSYKFVSPGLFRTTGARLVAGRELEQADIDDNRPVALVSENLAREIWGEPAAAIGKRVSANGRFFREIVGVVQDTYDNGLQEPPPTTFYQPTYLPEGDFAQNNVVFAIRSSRAGSATLIREIEQAVWSVNANLALAGVRTMQDYYDRSLARTSFTLVMLAIAGAAALVLGVVGLYGTISYVVAQRRREIAIRLALGAQQRAVTRAFVLYGAGLAAVGVLIGLGAAAAVTRFMSAILFGVGALDPLTYTGVSLALAAAAVLASWLPARRAAAVDPMETLRAE
jgi:putative ABC transport system permease protein